MARTDTLPHFLTDVADAIREKTGSQETIQASDFDVEITNLPSGPEDIKMVESAEEMNALQNVSAGDVCVIRDETPLTPWVLGETNSNVLCFPSEVDIQDIKQEFLDEYDGYARFDIKKAGGSLEGTFYISIGDDEAVFNFHNSNNDDFQVYYSFSNNKFIKTELRYVYNNVQQTIHDYCDGVITRNAYNIMPYGSASVSDTFLINLLGRFVKTKEYKHYSDGTHCIYFPYEISVAEPFEFEGDFAISNGVERQLSVMFQPSSDTYSIGITNDSQEIYYEYNYENGKYEGSGELSNVIFTPSDELEIMPSSSLTDEQMQEVINAGLLKNVADSFPQMYIYDGTNWTKLSQNGSPYEC